MNPNWLKIWDDRYQESGYAYGDQPNEYLKEQLKKFEPKQILFPAEGEGRNAVFAATLGWQTYAFDISEAGRKKAIALAEKQNVKIDYQVGELSSLKYKDEAFDAIGLIYAHFPADVRVDILATLSRLLKKNGIIIFEAFSKSHLEYVNKDANVGGPKDINMLFSIDEIKSYFNDYSIIELVEQEIELKEGHYHNGIGSVIRFVGRKN